MAHSFLTYTQKETRYVRLQEEDWKTQHFKHEEVPILKASREALAVRIWTHFLTFL